MSCAIKDLIDTAWIARHTGYDTDGRAERTYDVDNMEAITCRIQQRSDVRTVLDGIECFGTAVLYTDEQSKFSEFDKIFITDSDALSKDLDRAFYPTSIKVSRELKTGSLALTKTVLVG